MSNLNYNLRYSDVSNRNEPRGILLQNWKWREAKNEVRNEAERGGRSRIKRGGSTLGQLGSESFQLFLLTWNKDKWLSIVFQNALGSSCQQQYFLSTADQENSVDARWTTRQQQTKKLLRKPSLPPLWSPLSSSSSSPSSSSSALYARRLRSPTMEEATVWRKGWLIQSMRSTTNIGTSRTMMHQKGREKQICPKLRWQCKDQSTTRRQQRRCFWRQTKMGAPTMSHRAEVLQVLTVTNTNTFRLTRPPWPPRPSWPPWPHHDHPD